MNKIEKILEIKHPSFDWVNDFFKKKEFDINYFPNTTNDFIFHNKNYPCGQNYLVDIGESKIKSFQNKLLIEKLKECVDHLNTIYQLKFCWVMVYPPKTLLNFHWDHGKNRHVVSFCGNNRFFNYEAHDDEFFGNNIEVELNNKLKSSVDDIDSFNEYFLKFYNRSQRKFIYIRVCSYCQKNRKIPYSSSEYKLHMFIIRKLSKYWNLCFNNIRR